MRKDVREFIRRLESVGLTVESTPGHYQLDATTLRRAHPTVENGRRAPSPSASPPYGTSTSFPFAAELSSSS
jgi:hypothetical protein